MFEVVEKMLETLMTNKPRIQDYIYREELSKKKRVRKPRKLQRSPKIIGYYREEDDESPETFTELKLPLLPSIIPEDDERCCKDDNTKKNNKVNNVRVKVLLTKKEAAELLAKYKKASLESIDAVNELVLNAQRVNVISITSLCQDMELSTIPEEDEDEYDDEEENEEEELISSSTC